MKTKLTTKAAIKTRRNMNYGEKTQAGVAINRKPEKEGPEMTRTFT